MNHPVRLFQRITSSGKFIPQIDGLRFIAIASVFALHANSVSGSHALALGWRGVHLFFVISGFILGLPFAAHALKGAPAVDLKRYFLRRVTRLEPPYILNILLCYIVMRTLHGVSVGHLLASLSYSHSLVYGAVSAINPVAWSLEVEIQFYCSVPLLASVYRLKHRRLVLLAIITAFSAGRFFYPSELTILGNLQFFAVGMLLADFYTCGLPKRSPLWDVISLAWPVVFLLPGPAFFAVLPFLCLVLYTAAFTGPLTSRVLSLAPVTAIGGMCYSIYLFHYQIICAVPHFWHSNRLVATIATILFCGGFYLLIERPCMNPNWPKDFVRFASHYKIARTCMTERHRDTVVEAERS